MSEPNSARTAAASVPLAWLLSALWAVTLLLAGAWGTSIQKGVEATARATQSIAASMAAVEARLDKLEREAEGHVDADRFGDLLEQQRAISTKLDRLLETRR